MQVSPVRVLIRIVASKLADLHFVPLEIKNRHIVDYMPENI